MAHPSISRAAVLGQVLAYHRKAKGFQQAEVAARVGVTQATWSRIERGSIGISVEQLNLAAQCLGMPPWTILEEANRAFIHIEKQKVELRARTDATAGLLAIGLLAGAALGLLVAEALKKRN